MKQLDFVSNWLNSVAYSHSQSKATEEQYKRVWSRFSSFINKSANQILADYDASDDRTFKRLYAQHIRAWIADLSKEGLTNTSIKVMIGAVKSFFKYNDLPLGMVPQAMDGIVFHNRDVTKEEIVQIMAISRPREKAFFALMTQSGLRPHTIRQLRLSNLESLDAVPCKIEVPREIAKGKYGSYVTFIGPDAVKYLRQYFATRTNLAPESLVFCAHDDPTKPVNVKDESRAFRLAARKLEQTGAIDFEIRRGKPSELRFYTLRKFFRKQAHQMGFENVNYLMGHTIRGSDANYKPQDPEFYRDLYKEKAMPFLRLETATPTETEKTMTELKKQLEERDREIGDMKRMMVKLQPLVDFMNRHPTEEEMKKELGLDGKDDLSIELRPKKNAEEAVAGVINSIRDDDRLEELFHKKGLPITKEEYDERKRKLDKTNR
jgi:site-specific recombinase XerC